MGRIMELPRGVIGNAPAFGAEVVGSNPTGAMFKRKGFYG